MQVLRWIRVPFACLIAFGIGLYIWGQLGVISLENCPPEKVWYGAASLDKKCRWPIEVFFVKDVLGASILGLCIVLACGMSAPTHKKICMFSSSAIFSVLGAWYLWEQFNMWNMVLPHRLAVGLTFTISLFLTAILTSIGMNRFATKNPEALTDFPD
jgi:hypothetical protein